MDANPDEKQDSSLVEWRVTRPSCGLGEMKLQKGVEMGRQAAWAPDRQAQFQRHARKTDSGIRRQDGLVFLKTGSQAEVSGNDNQP